MTEGYGGVNDFTNKFLPREKPFQTGKIDFPNYLKIDSKEQLDENEVADEITVGKYLPFHQNEKTALENQERTSTKSVEEYFPSFKESSQHRERGSQWQSFLDESPRRSRFVPSNVPSILKGMKVPQNQKDATVDYKLLERELHILPDDLLVFSTEELPLVEMDESVIVQKSSQQLPKAKHKSNKNSHQPVIRKHVTQSEQMIQDTLLQDIPDTRAMEALAAPLKPATGKQRRAMNRSLSWIMEQEQGSDSLPYGKE